MSDEIDLQEIELYELPRSHSNYIFYAYPQAERLLAIHREIGGSGRGRRHNLEVLNKSTIVLTCAFWEAFVEDLNADALLHLAEHAESAGQLPMELRKSITKDLQSRKHELAMWEVADDQWRDLLRSRAEKIVSVTDRTLSSPSSEKVDRFFLQQSGIAGVSDSWRWPGISPAIARGKLDKFVSLRNAIAHRGGPRDEAVLKRDAEKGISLIDKLVEASISAVDEQLKAATGVELVRRIDLDEFPSAD